MDHRVLSEKSLARLKRVIAQPAHEAVINYGLILDWAQDPEYGGLPSYSARPFAHWLDDNWNNWTDDESATAEQVLQGAVTDWCGGRVMPS